MFGGACWGGDTTYEGNAYPTPEQFKEAPSLRKEAAAGRLPPVEERLPDVPVVVGPGVLVADDDLEWEVGRYGGTLVGATSQINDDPDLRQAAMEHFINTPKMQRGPITGNIAESLTVNEDNTVFTLRLRKGLKWSDGHPVTTEDVHFAFEDVILNEKITPVVLPTFRSGGITQGEPLRLEVVDTYTFRLISAEPYGGLLVDLGVGSIWGDYSGFIKPKHYLKQFHARYTPLEKMRPALEREGLGDQWWRLYQQKDIVQEVNQGRQLGDDAVGFPVLSPWMRVESPDDRMVMVRNPYYFKVDTEGNQLPYIDRYETLRVANVEMIPMKVISGETNILRIRCTPDKMPLYRKYEKEGKFRIATTLTMHNAPIALFINLTNPDPDWQGVVRDVRFRRAVNMSIDREKIIEVFYFGRGKPSPWVPQEFDVQGARVLLDQMGMRDRNGDGWLEDPTGKAFIMPVVVSPTTTSWQRICELLCDGFREIGLKTTMKTISANLIRRRSIANRLHVTVDWLDTPNWDRLLMDDYLPNDRARYGHAWHLWKETDGRKGEKPPAWVEEIYEIYREVLSVRPDSSRADELAETLREWMHVNLPMLPLGSEIMNPMIVPVNIGNFAHSGMASAAHFGAEQFFLRGPRHQN